MKTGIISDIHGNFEALKAVLDALKKEKVDRIVCLGDVVGYGPDPNLCIDRIKQTAFATIMGNHDAAAINSISTHDFNENARIAIEWTQKVLGFEQVMFLNTLPMVFTEKDWMAVHATPKAPEAWDYIFTESQIVQNLKAMEKPICFIGHSHMPIAFIQEPNGDILVRNAEEIHFEPSKKYLINVGSVGQPRDGDPRAAYGIFDEEKRVFTLKRIPYEIPKVQEKMRVSGLPIPLIERIAEGW